MVLWSYGLLVLILHIYGDDGKEAFFIFSFQQNLTDLQYGFHKALR